MDEEMEDRILFTLTAVEIDLDYEFDAARYFDFSREESVGEAFEAEAWFQSAGTYPPSPFVTRSVLREEVLLDNVNTSPKSEGVGNMMLLDSDPALRLGPDFSAMDVSNRGMEREISLDLKSYSIQKFQNEAHHLPTGLILYNHTRNDKSKAKTKFVGKPSVPRTSTLMKPTASQLAKQNQPRQVDDPRLRLPKLDNNERSSHNSFVNESQAVKRQKLEGGHLRKVADTNQEFNLVHKTAKKDVTIDGNSAHAKLRLTIPRGPDLKTAHRAHRMRPKTSRESEHVTSTGHAFRAVPLNKKIFEAPSFSLPKRSSPRLPDFQEFHLKTSERAMQHASAVSSSSVHCNNSKVLHKLSTVSSSECGSRESRRPNVVDPSKQEGCDIIHKFKTLPLAKKTISSKEDIGVYRNSKRETTEPTEFNFHTEKHDPPSELFSHLSLTSELQPSGGSKLRLPRPTCIFSKVSKENRSGSFQPESEIKHLVKGKPPRFGLKHIQCGSDGGIAEVGVLSTMSRKQTQDVKYIRDYYFA